MGRDIPLLERRLPINGLYAVIPVKPLARCKQRLGDRLGTLRPGLALAMLKDVLSALGDSARLSAVVVVTLDERVERLARANGAIVIEEATPGGMNRAIEQGIAEARRSGASHAVVVPVDIPLLTGSEFDRLVDQLEKASAVAHGHSMGIVPSRDGGGTNWMCVPTDAPFVPLYGPDSYHRHLRQGRALGLNPLTLDSPTLALDLDHAADLAAFAAHCRSNQEFADTHTWRFLDGLGYDPGTDRLPQAAETEASSHA